MSKETNESNSSLIIVKKTGGSNLNSAIRVNWSIDEIPEEVKEFPWYGGAVEGDETWVRKNSMMVNLETHDPLTAMVPYFSSILKDVNKLAEKEGFKLEEVFSLWDGSNLLGEEDEEQQILVLHQYYQPGASSSSNGNSEGLDKVDDIAEVLEENYGISFYEEDSNVANFTASDKTKQVHYSIGLKKTHRVSGNGSSSVVLSFLEDPEVQDAAREVIRLAGEYDEKIKELIALQEAHKNKK